MRWVSILLVSLAAGVHAAPDSRPEAALADYVAAPDASFAWRVHGRYSTPRAEIVELRLVSQTWRGVAWRHQLYLIKPAGLDPAVRQGLLVIGGGRWRDSYDTESSASLPEGSGVFVAIAEQLETVVAVLGQVPFQPLFGLTEDELIAHTFEQYLASGDAEWPLLLPMVKSAVKAMDATHAAAAAEWQVGLERFTVLGGSKRGWATWLLGAVEPRAAALVPVVIDALNLERHMPYQSLIWGAPSEKISPYTRRGLHEVLGSDAGRDLRTIVDPYSYRTVLTQPKLVVVATNDEYFPLDAMNLYWDALPEPKYVLYLPNDGHSIEDYARLIPSLHALHRRSADGVALPELAWEFADGNDALRLCLSAQPAPALVTAWTAESVDSDFRNEEFVPARVELDDSVFVLKLERPAAGFKAVFAESVFDDGAALYSFSTNLRILAADGQPPSQLTAIRGTPGICPRD
jgi:PhoPQ-activated pathogenicity-related protein